MSTVSVDHNYPSANNLRYQAANGTPVEGAVVRIFKKPDFDQGLTDVAIAVTLTDVNGGWVDPVFLDAGFTYVVQFSKEGVYGPDHTEVIV